MPAPSAAASTAATGIVQRNGTPNFVASVAAV